MKGDFAECLWSSIWSPVQAAFRGFIRPYSLIAGKKYLDRATPNEDNEGRRSKSVNHRRGADDESTHFPEGRRPGAARTQVGGIALAAFHGRSCFSQYKGESMHPALHD